MGKWGLWALALGFTQVLGDTQEKYFSLQEGDVLRINHQCGDIVWKKSDGEKTRIKVERRKNKGDVLFSYKNGVLTLDSVKEIPSRRSFLGNRYTCSEVDIHIESSVNLKIEAFIDIGSFKTHRKDKTPLKDLDVQVNIGNIDLEGLIQEASLKVDIGHIELYYHKDSSFKGDFKVDLGSIERGKNQEDYYSLGHCRYQFTQNQGASLLFGEVNLGSINVGYYAEEGK